MDKESQVAGRYFITSIREEDGFSIADLSMDIISKGIVGTLSVQGSIMNDLKDRIENGVVDIVIKYPEK